MTPRAHRLVASLERYRYPVALGLVAAAALVRTGLDPWLGELAAFVLFLLCAVIAAWIGGLGPGLVAAVLGIFVGWMLFIGQPWSLDFTRAATPLLLVFNLVVGVLIAMVGGMMHRARRDAREQADRVSSTLESMSDSFMRLDDELRFVYVNCAVERSLDADRSDLIGRKLVEVYPEIEGTLGHREYERAVRERVPVEFEHYQKEWDRWFWAKADPMPGGGLAVYYHEITDRKRHEEAVRKSEERYRTLFTTIDEGFAIIEMIFDEAGEPVDYRFVDLNPAFERHTGLRDAEGRTARELMPNLEAFWFETFGEVARTGEPARFTHNAKIMDDHWFEVYAFRIGEPESRQVGLLFNNITEREAAEARLKEVTAESERQRRLYETILAGTPDLVYVFDLDYRFTFVNKALQEMWGRTLGQSLGKTLLEIGYEPWHAAMHEGEIDRVVATKKPIRGEVSFPHAKLGVREYDYIFVPVINEDGEVEAVAGTTRDITERKRAEEALKEANQRKDEFLATLAHELRNPLAAICMALNVSKASREEQSRAGMIDIIERQASLLTRLIDDLLDVSRITRGKVALQKKLLDLRTIVEQAVEGVNSTCNTRELELSVALPTQPIVVNGDGMRLAQVVSNLVNNACKFTDRGGTVRVSVEREDGEAVIRVRDTGKGIPRDQLAHIFDLFNQIEGAPGRGSDGLGIGLSLAKALTERHGGTIEAHSDGPGKGSEFIVRLPVSEREHEYAAPQRMVIGEAAPLKATASDLPVRVLAVDDNADALSAIATMLEISGYEVRTAPDGERALALAREYEPDVVLLDIGMPGMDGYEVAQRIRSEPWGEEMLLVAMTGWGQERDKQFALEAGFDEHLTKPADLNILQGILARRSRSAAVKGTRSFH